MRAYQLTSNINHNGTVIPAGTKVTSKEVGGKETIQRWIKAGMAVAVEAETGAQSVVAPEDEPAEEEA